MKGRPLRVSGPVLHPIPHTLPAELKLWWVELEGWAASGSIYGLCRRLVLEVLSRELGRRVEESEIVTTSAGKPRLEGSEVTFNLSHSATEALIGIGSDSEVGVDLEVIRQVPEADALVAEYFTPSERETWMRQPPEKRDRLLLDCWTRKEACLKAVGAGLSWPPATIETGPGPESVRVLIDVGTASGSIEVSSLTLPSGSAGAAALFTTRAA